MGSIYYYIHPVASYKYFSLFILTGSGLLRGELHEMLIPAALRQPWTNLENSVYLNSYFIRTIPCPEDRVYKKFGFFVKAPLPKEAERMKLDLHLAHQRSVSTELIPSGLVEFNKNEVRYIAVTRVLL